MRARAASLVFVACACLGRGTAAQPETPLTLQDAVRLARKNHPTIEARRGEAASAYGRQEQALARLLPFAQASAAYEPTTPNLVITPSQARTVFFQSNSATVVDTSGTAIGVTCRTPAVGTCTPASLPPPQWTPQSFWAAQLGLSWTAWDWGRSLLGYRGARELATASEVNVRSAELDVTLQAALAFFGALAADEQVRVAEDAARTYQAHLAQTRGLHDSGLRTGIDVATAESAAASVEITRARAVAAREAARAQLQVALGVPRWGDWRLVAEPAAFEVQAADEQRSAAPVAELVEVASAHRPDLEALRLEERGLGDQARATRGSLLPQLTLSVSPTWEGGQLSSLTPNLTWMVGLAYPSPGLSPWLVQGQSREAEGALVAAHAERRAALDAIRAETVTAQASLIAARDELRFARTLVDASARQRGLAEGRYQTGVGNVIELYDALLTDVSARSQLVQARLDLASARARLQHALGESP
ncbi:MAG TPA: TolC family protein [Polyangia bacterium]|nr:TolC family protein [Polyangia bacterium]